MANVRVVLRVLPHGEAGFLRHCVAFDRHRGSFLGCASSFLSSGPFTQRFYLLSNNLPIVNPSSLNPKRGMQCGKDGPPAATTWLHVSGWLCCAITARLK